MTIRKQSSEPGITTVVDSPQELDRATIGCSLSGSYLFVVGLHDDCACAHASAATATDTAANRRVDAGA
jgi:hypothetical protein